MQKSCQLQMTLFAIQKLEAPISEERIGTFNLQDELFAKLQNYKKLLDNGLILQGEYDRLKGEIF